MRSDHSNVPNNFSDVNGRRPACTPSPMCKTDLTNHKFYVLKKTPTPTHDPLALTWHCRASVDMALCDQTSMDRFVTITKRKRDETPMSLSQELALCPCVDEICQLEADAVALFDAYEREQWYDLGVPPACLKHRQLLFGQRGGDNPGRASHDVVMPPVLNEIYKHARSALMVHPNGAFLDLPEEASGCAINRYDPTLNGKGSGLGPHRDKGAWKPLVVGVTLVESRQMVFSDDYKQNAKVTYKLPTERGSVYGFRDCMFTKWYHESLKKGASQQKTIYSITYRFL